ncbi:MAG: glycine betaine ABC transporter substrate-binding protein, partial [Spirochaetaceae bacterium]
LIVAMLLLLSGVVMAGGQGETSGETQTVVFADGSWDSILVHNRIAAFILENGYGGYEAEYVPGDTIPLFNGLASGDIDVYMESWHSNYLEAYDEKMEEGSIVNLGENLPDGPQGWWIPRYMVDGDSERGIEATAPNLVSVDDLPEYADLFPDPENPGKGRIFVGPPGWKATEISEEIMEEHGLYEDFTAFLPGSGASLAASMKGAYDAGEPWVGYYWEPTAIMYQLDMVRLEGSEFPAADVDILMNAESAEEMPEVREFLSNYGTSVDVNNEFLNVLETEVEDAEEAAEWFLRNREDVWTEWVPDEVAEEVRAALQ